MAILSIEHFLTAGTDLERAQYTILGALRSVKDDFARSAIYPHLSDLIDLHKTLRNLLDQLGGIRGAIPTPIESINPDSEETIQREEAPDLGAVGILTELIAWSLPKVTDIIEEGKTIFEFVDASLHVEQVGILPGYTEEGYLIIPDRAADELCVFRYVMSSVTRANERYRSLRTRPIKRMADRKVIPPQHLKLELAREQPDLPNPATYYVDSELEFPFDQTVMPIAKRKLMRHLYRQGGAA
jgi:hypothetical protein